MPKTAINEDRDSCTSEDYIRAAPLIWNRTVVDGVA